MMSVLRLTITIDRQIVHQDLLSVLIAIGAIDHLRAGLAHRPNLQSTLMLQEFEVADRVVALHDDDQEVLLREEDMKAVATAVDQDLHLPEASRPEEIATSDHPPELAAHRDLPLLELVPLRR